jgi:hypothetical protein
MKVTVMGSRAAVWPEDPLTTDVATGVLNSASVEPVEDHDGGSKLLGPSVRDGRGDA